MKKSLLLLVFLSILLLLFAAFVIISKGLKKPQPITVGNKKSVILTHTTFNQLQRGDWLNLFFSESYRNPYTYGWKGEDLFYKDSLGNNFSLSSGDKEPKRENIDNLQFLRQEKKYSECNLSNSPDYSEISNYPGEISDICYVVEHSDVKIEAWPYLSEESLLAVGVRHLVITKGDDKIVIDEPRIVSDIIISESGKLVAITTSNQVSYPHFDATDIHILDLD